MDNNDLSYFFIITLFAVSCLILGILGSSLVEQTKNNGTTIPAIFEIENNEEQTEDLNIHIANSFFMKAQCTKSMIPTFDCTNNLIAVFPENMSQLKKGMIACYKDPNKERGCIVHRIVAVKEDSYGTYYLFKGDNALFKDNIKVRSEDIDSVIVGVIY